MVTTLLSGVLNYELQTIKGKAIMKRCQICGKQSSTGHMVSHSKRRTKRRWLPNLQRIKIKLNGQVTRAYVCTSCIRSDKVEKVV